MGNYTVYAQPPEGIPGAAVRRETSTKHTGSSGGSKGGLIPGQGDGSYSPSMRWGVKSWFEGDSLQLPGEGEAGGGRGVRR